MRQERLSRAASDYLVAPEIDGMEIQSLVTGRREMSTLFQCDGCRIAVEEPARIGRVLARDYCETCKAAAEAFIAAEEELRARTQEKFAGERAKLIKKFAADGFKLPDVP